MVPPLGLLGVLVAGLYIERVVRGSLLQEKKKRKQKHYVAVCLENALFLKSLTSLPSIL